MEKTKHTPAPWYAVNYGGYVNIQSTNYYENNTNILDEDKCNRAEANGLLCAAAPELLAACMEFVRKCECGEARSKRSYAQMKAAINKAIGIKA